MSLWTQGSPALIAKQDSVDQEIINFPWGHIGEIVEEVLSYYVVIGPYLSLYNDNNWAQHQSRPDQCPRS